jgi:heptosyltransferase-2
MKSLERWFKHHLARTLAAAFPATPRELEEILDPEPRSILVIRQQNQMGDMLLAVPAFRGLRERFPRSRIDLLTASINRGVVLNNPYLDRIHTYAKERHRRNPFSVPAFLFALRRRRYDLVVVLHTVSFSVTSAILAMLCGARHRVGATGAPFGAPFTRRLFHAELPLPDEEELRSLHESEHNLYPLAPLGVHTSDLSSVLVPSRHDEAWAESFLGACGASGTGPTVALHPGAGKAANIWPAERFGAVAGWLRAERDARLLVIEGPRDEEPAACVRASLGGEAARVANRTVGELGALLRRCDLLLCNDTGVMHVGGAVGTTTLALFGPTDPGRWKPAVDHVVAVRGRDGTLDSVEVEEVLERLGGLLPASARAGA